MAKGQWNHSNFVHPQPNNFMRKTNKVVTFVTITNAIIAVAMTTTQVGTKMALNGQRRDNLTPCNGNPSGRVFDHSFFAVAFQETEQGDCRLFR